MTAPAPPPDRTRPSSAARLSLLAALLLAAGCAAEAPPAQEEAATAAASGNDCLVLVWQGQADPDRDFDRANDRVEGGAISCATGTSPSQFEAALAAIREAAGSGDKARLLAQLGIPLRYIDAAGNPRSLEEPEAIDALFDEVFSPETLALLERVRLDDLTVVPGEGAFVELGAVWLVVDRPGGRPKIVTVNRQALDEAAAAAARAAQEGKASPAPMER